MNKIILFIAGIVLAMSCTEQKNIAPNVVQQIDTVLAIKKAYQQLQTAYGYTGEMTGYKFNVNYTVATSEFYITNTTSDYIRNGYRDSAGVDVKMTYTDSIKYNQILGEKLQKPSNDTTVVAHSFTVLTTKGKFTVYLKPVTLELLTNTVTYPGEKFFKPLDYYLDSSVFGKEFYY